MMKMTHGALAGLILTLALACVLQCRSQSSIASYADARVTPEPVNLDIPPDEPIDPVEEQEEEMARSAIHNPAAFHDALVRVEHGREAREQRSAAAILDPPGFRRAHPPPAEQIRAEAAAAQAILNIKMVLPSLPNSQ
jgi:hypothetical protein